MVVVTALHAYYSKEHLEYVTQQMQRLGAPWLRAYFDHDTGAWFAQEGTHRLRAALRLDMTPVMLPVPWPRSRKALERARYAAVLRGHCFKRIDVYGSQVAPGTVSNACA